MARNRELSPLETPSPGAVNRTLFHRVTEYLTEKDWSNSSIEEKGYFRFVLRLRDGSVQVAIDVAEVPGWSRMMVFSSLPVFVPEARRAAVSEALHRVNYESAFGHFEIDCNDGEVRARATLDGDNFISNAMIDRAIRKSLDLAEQYFAPILAVAFGNAASDGILEMASRGDETPLQ